MLINRPTADEFSPFYNTYIRLIPDGVSPLTLLREQPTVLKTLLKHLTDEQALFRYAPGKWSIKESLVHMTDTERIFAYRALRLGRGDQTPLPGFDQNDYVPVSGADRRPLTAIWAEYDAVRAATLTLLTSFDVDTFSLTGIVSDGPMSLRALTYIIPGHEAHHINLFQNRYLPHLP